MSRDQDEDEKRLYQCVKKYEKIVQQFDVLVEIMNARNRLPSKQKNRRGSNNTNHAQASQSENNEVLVQTITTFLQELRCSPSTSTTEPISSSSNGNQN